MLLLRKPCRTFISPQIKTKFQFPPQVSLDTAKFFWISRQMTKTQKNPNRTKIKKKTTPNSKIIWNVVSKCSPCCLTKGRALKLRGQEPGNSLGTCTKPRPALASCPSQVAHTAAPGDLLCSRTRLKPQHHRVLEHRQAVQLPPQAAGAPPVRQAKPPDQYGQHKDNWEPLPSHGRSQQL